jgi:hypothetical protein
MVNLLLFAALVLPPAARDVGLPERVRTVPPFASSELAPVDPPPAVSWPLWSYGRVVTLPALHVGVRPHLLLSTAEGGAAVTVQLRLPILEVTP